MLQCTITIILKVIKFHRTLKLCINVATHSTYTSGGAVLPTAMLLVSDSLNNLYPCRALLDNCSESNFITEEMVNLIKSDRQARKIKILGIGNSSCGTSKGIVTINVSSFNNNFRKTIQALVVPRITTGISGVSFPNLNLNIDLADPKFGQPGKIDLLLGVGVVSEIFIDGKLTGFLGNLVAQNTTLGYVVMGECGDRGPRIATHTNLTSLENILQQFWELNEVDESYGLCNKLSEEPDKNDQYCEEHFLKTFRHDKEGKYILQLRFCKDPEVLGDSYAIALKRLTSIERRMPSL